MVEFGAKISLDSKSATDQVKKFSAELSDASRTLKRFQAETRSTMQLGDNVFRGYITSSKRAAVQTENSIKKMHDQRKAFKDLNAVEKDLINTVDRLNRKYDTSAAKEHKLLLIRRELRQVVAAGLKTQKEANAIYDREAHALDKTTNSYKLKQQQIKINNNLHAQEARKIAELKNKYLGLQGAEKAEAKVVKELNLLKRKGLLDNKNYNRILKEQRKHIEHVTSRTIALTSAQHKLAKAARVVSVLSRVLLGLYAVARIGRFAKDVEETAEKIGLLQNKLEFLTGDSGAYRKLFLMTQDVGIELEAANKIITRFAVVTDKAFSIETLNEWTTTIVKSARATGTSSQEMRGALIQITQAMSAGRLMGDEYRSVTENLPLFTVALRELFGESTLSLKELSSQGLLTNDVLIKGFDRLKGIVAGFPDSTKTVEAAIGRLSASWDNFLSKASNTTFSKDIMNTTSEFLNLLGTAITIWDKLGEIADKFSSFSEVKDIQEKIAEKEGKLADLLKNKDSNFTLEYFDDKNIAAYKKEIKELKDDLSEILAEQKKIKDEEEDISAAKAKKKLYDDKVQAVKEEVKLTKERLRLEKMLEKFSGGESIARVKRQAELNRSELEASNLRFHEGKVGADDEQREQGLIDINKTEKEGIDRIHKTRVDGALRAKNLKTDFNIEDINNQIRHDGKLYAIAKKHTDNVLQVKSAEQALLIEISEGIPESDRIGISAEKAEILMDALDVQKAKAIATELYDIGNAITEIGNSSAGSIISLEQDKLDKEPQSKYAPPVSNSDRALGEAQLLIDNTKLVAEYNASYLDLQDRMIEVANVEGERGVAAREALELEMEMLGEKKLRQEEALSTDFMEEFDNATIIQMEMAQELVDMWDSVADSIASGLGDAFASAIVDQDDLGKALQSLMKQVAKQVISSLIEIGIQRAIMAITAVTTEKTVMANSVSTAAATASAWAAAAAAVNAATFGAAAAAGAIQLANIAAVSTALFATPKAHSGLDRTEEGTMLLRRDEMVLDPGTSKKVRDNMIGATDDLGGEAGGGVGGLQVNISAIDVDSFIDRVGSPVVMNEIWDRFNERLTEEGKSI